MIILFLLLLVAMFSIDRTHGKNIYKQEFLCFCSGKLFNGDCLFVTLQSFLGFIDDYKIVRFQWFFKIKEIIKIKNTLQIWGWELVTSFCI